MFLVGLMIGVENLFRSEIFLLTAIRDWYRTNISTRKEYIMKILWNGENRFNTMDKTYKTYQNAVKAAEKIIGERNIRVIIASTPEGRFFPVALGHDALS